MAEKVQIVIEVDGKQGTAQIQQIKTGLSSLGPVSASAGQAASAGIGQVTASVSKLQSSFSGLAPVIRGALGLFGITASVTPRKPPD